MSFPPSFPSSSPTPTPGPSRNPSPSSFPVSFPTELPRLWEHNPSDHLRLAQAWRFGSSSPLHPSTDDPLKFPLHRAVREHHVNEARRLWAEGADPLERNLRGHTPLEEYGFECRFLNVPMDPDWVAEVRRAERGQRPLRPDVVHLPA